LKNDSSRITAFDTVSDTMSSEPVTHGCLHTVFHGLECINCRLVQLWTS